MNVRMSVSYRLRWITALLCLAALALLLWHHDHLNTTPSPPARLSHHARAAPPARPGPTIEAYVRPAFAVRMRRLRSVILRAAAQHNHPQLSGMSDQEFAVVIATILYNENFGWAEELAPPLRAVTPWYQSLQQQLNLLGMGANLSVWPANLRPSVAAEILAGEIPLADGRLAYAPLRVQGSQINPDQFSDQRAFFAALTDEIMNDELAVNYLAANLERGMLRAALEDQPITWRTLAAWHNQGIVDPIVIQANPTARDYLRRATAYLPLARALFDSVSQPGLDAL